MKNSIPIVMTGAAGEAAQMILPHLRARFPALTLTDIAPAEGVIPCDLRDLPGLRKILRGAKGVVHLGGQRDDDAPWQTILESNIGGTRNVFEAARLEGAERVVFASSNHAAGFMPARRPFAPADRARPDGPYGASKVFGESMASLYADKHGLRTLCVRIGKVLPAPESRRHLSIWIHPEDLAGLIAVGLTHPGIHCEIVYGVSRTARPDFDNSAAFRLGYAPRHGADGHAERLRDSGPDFDFVGGGFAEANFDGDRARTLRAVGEEPGGANRGAKKS